MASGRPETAAEGRLSRLLGSPVIGMTPWIAMSVLVGPGRYELAVGVSLALAVAIVIAGRIRSPGASLKILEISDVVFFAAMAVIGIFASPGMHRWLESYSGELSNIALMVIALGSMAVKVPFTLQYAREQVPREFWDNPRFLRTNYRITGAWAAAFGVAAIAGAYGDLVLHDANNLWTGGSSKSRPSSSRSSSPGGIRRSCVRVPCGNAVCPARRNHRSAACSFRRRAI
ncbi:hypothetical protein [Streptomyces decoyicus]